MQFEVRRKRESICCDHFSPNVLTQIFSGHFDWDKGEGKFPQRFPRGGTDKGTELEGVRIWAKKKHRNSL
tara:strand:+ start:10903 stop:11112 length:210 start_codon:yes stop_codon:yes gene_type:complete